MRNCSNPWSMSRLAIFLFFIFFFPDVFGQASVHITESPVEALSKKLTSGHKTEVEKVRSIFLWITGNISYHTRSVIPNRKKKQGEFVFEEEDSSATLLPLAEHVAGIVLKRGTAVCDGYTKLFKSLCDHAGITSEIIMGYARTNFGNNPKFRTNHSWNAVYVDSSWHLLDVTWASGFVYGNMFVRYFDDNYFFTPPRYFIRDHYPEDLKWTLLNDPPLPKEQWASPFLFTEYIRQKMVSFSPSKGIMEARMGDELKFKLESEHLKARFAVTDDPLIDSAKLNFVTATNGKAECSYFVSNEKTEWLYIVCNEEIVLRYRLNLKTQNKRSE
jgi:transglutaminase/protease-like cytokinesis protein 3